MIKLLFLQLKKFYLCSGSDKLHISSKNGHKLGQPLLQLPTLKPGELEKDSASTVIHESGDFVNFLRDLVQGTVPGTCPIIKALKLFKRVVIRLTFSDSFRGLLVTPRNIAQAKIYSAIFNIIFS